MGDSSEKMQGIKRTAKEKAIFGVGKKRKNPETHMVTGFFNGGSGGIRTHEPVKAT